MRELMTSRRARYVGLALAWVVLVTGLLGTGGDTADEEARHPVRDRAGEPAPQATWALTTGDRRQLLSPQKPVELGPDQPSGPNQIKVDAGVRHQTVRGMGAALTESSAVLLDQLPTATRTKVLEKLFSRSNGAGISVLRTPFGASDFALSDYTFDDLPPGTTDPGLSGFSIERDRTHVMPLLSAAHGINPGLTAVATPWSAPAWMKTSGTTHGGSLADRWKDAYARYLTEAVEQYRAAGAPVEALTVANEPKLSTPGYPSMQMSAEQQADFVGTHLRPALDAAGLEAVGVLGYDHTWDDTAYPMSLLTREHRGSFAGAAFHCYEGDESAQSRVAAAAPGKQIWTTECSGGDWSTTFAANLRWNAHHTVIGAFRNSSTASLMFNLALDADGGPTNGGCRDCRGVITIDPDTKSVTYNVEYWLLAHVGRYVTPGAVRIDSTATTSAGVESVAFLNPDGSHALVLFNGAGTAQPVTVRWAGRSTQVDLPAGAVATVRW